MANKTDAWIETTDSDAKYGKGQPQSPYNSVRSTECGHYEEYDSTPGNERIRVQHRSGTFKEYQATGNCVHKIVGDGYHIVMKDNNVLINGSCKVQIMGDLEMHVGGNMHLLVDGDFTQTVKGNHNTTVKGDHKAECTGTIQHTASDVKHQSTGDLTISGNLNVRGDVICQQTVSALGCLTSGGHLSIQGSIMALGAVPQTGGEPLPHIISGIFPGIGMMINTVGAIEATSATAAFITAPINIINGITNINGVTSIKGATSILGITKITGATKILGATNITGATSIKGALDVSGSSTLKGGATINGIMFNTHKHTSSVPGSPTSPPTP